MLVFFFRNSSDNPNLNILSGNSRRENLLTLLATPFLSFLRLSGPPRLRRQSHSRRRSTIAASVAFLLAVVLHGFGHYSSTISHWQSSPILKQCGTMRLRTPTSMWMRDGTSQSHSVVKGVLLRSRAADSVALNWLRGSPSPFPPQQLPKQKTCWFNSLFGLPQVGV